MPGRTITHRSNKLKSLNVYITAWPTTSGSSTSWFGRLYMFGGNVLHGNFGYDLKQSAPVISLMAPALLRSVVLAAIGTAAGLLIGIPLGTFQAVRRYSFPDHLFTGIGFIGYGSPTFFVGILLVNWFAVGLHIFPAFAPQASSLAGILSDPLALVLPVATYAFVAFALWSRFMRSSVLDNLVQDYVRIARAKGASERRVLWGHIFRNSLISIVTLLGLQLPVIIGGSVFIEVVFNYPGMGLQLPVRQGVALPAVLDQPPEPAGGRMTGAIGTAVTGASPRGEAGTS